jgi:hypothetical protein
MLACSGPVVGDSTASKYQSVQVVELIGETFGPSKEELLDVQITLEASFAGTAGTIVVVACSEGASRRIDKREGECKCILAAVADSLETCQYEPEFSRHIYFAMHSLRE